MASLKETLQSTLVERCRKNPSYSLRAFARSLEMEPSALSKILNGRRSISKSMCQRLCDRLGILSTDFINDTNFTSEKGMSIYKTVETDIFHLIADWYYYAILQLVQVKGFKADARWISRSLGITASEANIAVERLFRLQLLKKNPQGQWVDSGSLTTLGHQFSVASFRRLQRQILEKAIEALENIPMSERDQTSMTMAIDSKRLPEARERIKKFRRSLDRFLQGRGRGSDAAGGIKDRVYHLSISLYPVSHRQRHRLLAENKKSKNKNFENLKKSKLETEEPEND